MAANRFAGLAAQQGWGFHDLSSEGRIRRATYVFGFTALFAAIAGGIVFLGFDSSVAETAVEGFIGLINLMIIFFLTTETVDRSQVLHNVGAGFRARGERETQILVQTPDQARAIANGDSESTSVDVTVTQGNGEDESVG